MTSIDHQGGVDRERFPLRGRDLALVVAFWVLLALLTIANRPVDPRSAAPALELWSPAVANPVLASLLWTLLTPPLFWLVGWASAERERVSPAVRAVLLVGAAVLAAVTVSAAVELFARTAFFDAMPRRGPRVRWRGGIWLLNHLIISMGVVAAALARVYSLRARARHEQAVRLQAQLAEARLSALRQQLDPHFLFNTLNAISALVERDPRGVRRMISRLSELLRHSIEGSGAQEVPLRQELELLQRYLDIMQVRFQGRLTVETRIDDRALDALVPNLILQPLVENAIKHGVAKSTGPARIGVEAEVAGGEVLLRVRDSGAGAGSPVEAATDAQPEGSGVGVSNTVARLEQLYGAAQHFALRPADGGGTVAEVRLPFHTRSDLPAAMRAAG